MPQVFISYRQVNDAQRDRVRALAVRLRACGIEVILDQFFLDDHPGGPPDGWPKWSSDRAIQTERVIIIGTEEWFLCFDNKQPTDTSLGAVAEAGVLRQRIYDHAGVNEDIRVVLLDDADATHISFDLKRYHRFYAERDFTNIVRWLGGTSPGAAPVAKTSIPNNFPRLQPFFGRTEELKQIAEALDPENLTWGALAAGEGRRGPALRPSRGGDLHPAPLAQPRGRPRDVAGVRSIARISDEILASPLGRGRPPSSRWRAGLP